MISKRTVETIERFASPAGGGKPFFISVHYTAPHWPWETRDDAALVECADLFSTYEHVCAKQLWRV